MDSSTPDTLLILIPFAIVVVASVFRLDEVFLKSRASRMVKRDRPRFANYDDKERTLLADPDGRVSGPRGKRPGSWGRDFGSGAARGAKEST
jgi:hypothetical protein